MSVFSLFTSFFLVVAIIECTESMKFPAGGNRNLSPLIGLPACSNHELPVFGLVAACSRKELYFGIRTGRKDSGKDKKSEETEYFFHKHSRKIKGVKYRYFIMRGV